MRPLTPSEANRVRTKMIDRVRMDFAYFMACYVLKRVDAEDPGAGRELLDTWRKNFFTAMANEAGRHPDMAKAFQGVTEEAFTHVLIEQLKHMAPKRKNQS